MLIEVKKMICLQIIWKILGKALNYHFQQMKILEKCFKDFQLII